MRARVVLFGECGFVGSNLLRSLQIDGIVAPTLKEADLTNISSLRNVLQPGDIVINAAGYANATDRTEQGKRLFQSINVEGLRNLADVCADVGVFQLIHISSVAAMGRQHGEGITEDMMVPVDSPYAQSKLDGEKLLADYLDKFPITILRPTSVFGEGRGLAATLCSLVKRGTVVLPEAGRAKVPFTYIGNVAHAVGLTIGNEACFGKTFIVGDETSYSLRDIVLALACGMGVNLRIINIPKPVACAGVRALELVAAIRQTTPLLDRGRLDTMIRSVSYSIEAFREATGYQPPYCLDSAANRITQWFLRNRT